MDKLRLWGAVCTAVCIYSSASAAAIFTPLGYLPGDVGSIAIGISDDGLAVVGRSDNPDWDYPYIGEAYRWTRNDGMVGLGYLPDLSELSAATDVSGDGSVVVGYSACCNGNIYQAFRWTSEDGMAGLGDLAAYGVSADGSVIVGQGESTSGREAFRWTSDDGMVGLGDLPGGYFSSIARSVSSDGSVVVGNGRSASGSEAFSWTSEDGMVGLGDLDGGDFSSVAYGVSADGSVVVGYSVSDLGYEAFRWTSDGGMVGLGDLNGGGFYSSAKGVSADGSVIVGQGESTSGREAFRWTREDGMQSVASILTAAGVDLSGWTLSIANGVSADGYTIIGSGTNPNGNTEAWVADLSVTPPPTTTVDLSGTIKTMDDADICAMVLASGQYMFSCNPIGEFTLTNLPREQNGTVKRQIYADGFLPKIVILTDSTEEDVVMTRSGSCPNYNTTPNPAFRPDSAGKRINIFGKVLLQGSQTPICAMVLANGQYMFTCDGTGNYALNIPLDTNGQFKLQVYADGFAPITQKFDEFSTNNDVRMARAVECVPGPVKILGPEEIVFDWTTDRCEVEDIPDLPARAFRDADGKVQLIATHYINRRMIGDELASVVRDCNVIMASDMDADPSQYNDREWISAVYTQDGVNIHALVHNEYLGSAHQGMCSSGDYFSCWYNSITYASSMDMGLTYTHAPAPQHRVANVPYEYVDGDGPYGIFEGSNIIRSPKDGYYYKLLHLEKYGEQDWGMGVMRTQALEDLTSWRCWDGEGFNASFIDPYTQENYYPAEHVCKPVSRDNIEKMADSLTYNTFFKKYLLVGTAGLYDPDVGDVVHGFYYSLSDDLINWSPRQLLMKAKLWWTPSLPGDAYGYPSLIDPDDDSMNFEYTDKQVYLYYTRWHIGSTYDRDLVRVPIEFTTK